MCPWQLDWWLMVKFKEISCLVSYLKFLFARRYRCVSWNVVESWSLWKRRRSVAECGQVETRLRCSETGRVARSSLFYRSTDTQSRSETSPPTYSKLPQIHNVAHLRQQHSLWRLAKYIFGKLTRSSGARKLMVTFAQPLTFVAMVTNIWEF